ncbi:hypothetical protein K1719_006592 [Acacia pycnantha]|nr:hypothetical protein K1719_006592 [Acacia pycnantha]
MSRVLPRHLPRHKSPEDIVTALTCVPNSLCLSPTILRPDSFIWFPLFPLCPPSSIHCYNLALVRSQSLSYCHVSNGDSTPLSPLIRILFRILAVHIFGARSGMEHHNEEGNTKRKSPLDFLGYRFGALNLFHEQEPYSRERKQEIKTIRVKLVGE